MSAVLPNGPHSAQHGAVRTPERLAKGARVVVAMSGGVDSCAAACLLHDQGYTVIGISMQVWDYRRNGGSASRATCCAPSDFEDAREIADAIGFPYYVYDFEESFRDEVISPFVRSYLRGTTPNPCLDCNRKVKFRQLRRRAAMLGAHTVATGHYAQIRTLPDGSLALYTSADRQKDQSYFLYAMTPHDLETTMFPVGHLEKKEVRRILAERGFQVASKSESQDICFVSGSVGDFIEAQSGGRAPGPGEIVDRSGRSLGTHGGTHRYTVGQRRGLGVSSEEPLYVIEIDADRNLVRLGGRNELERQAFSIGEVNWISGTPPERPITVRAKLRYRHGGVRCLVEPHPLPDDNTAVRASFLDEWSAVSPGQAAVFYEDAETGDGFQRVLGGGIIQKSREEAHV